MKIHVVCYSSSYDENYNGTLDNVAYSNPEAAKAHADWLNHHPDLNDVIYGARYYASVQEIPDHLADTFVAPSEESYAETKAQIDAWCRGEYEDPDLDYPPEDYAEEIELDPYDDPAV